MTKEFERTNYGVEHQYKVVANFRDNKITIFERYGSNPYSKSYVSTFKINRKDIYDIMYKFSTQDLRAFILRENFTAGKIRII